MGRKAFRLMPLVMAGFMMSFFFLSKDLIAQDFQVTGTVKDKLDEPVAGVTVLELGTSNVSTTDAEGKFSITVGKTATLQFIAMSYRTVDIPVNGRNVINVVLEDDVMALDQVVVTALGIQRQSKEIGYSTAKVSSEELNSSQNLDATQALAGKVSGLQIQVNSASLDSEVRVNLRGNRSFKGNNQALLVVDGVPTPLDYLQTMNPNDIENITVLKGGSAAALYGSAAANGVLYVTTKKGNIGKPRITYSLTTTFDKLAYFPEYQTRFGSGAENSVTGFPYYIAYENQQYGPEFDGSTVPVGAPIYDPENPDGKQLEGVYAYREGARESFYDTGVGIQNDISFQSGGENGSLFLSYQHADKSGIIPGDKYRRQTVRFSASRNYKSLRASVNASYSNTNTNMDNSTSNGMQALWNTPAHIYLGDYKDWRNVEGGDPDSWVNSYYLNPSAQVDLYRRESRRDRIQGSAQLDYKPLPWLSFQGRAGLVMGVTNKNNKDYAWHYSDFAKNSGRSYALSDYYTALTTSSNYYNRVTLDAMAFAEHEFSKKFKIKGMVGWSLQDTYSEYKDVSADRIQVDNLFNVDSKIGELGGSNEYTQSRKLAVYGSIDFSLFGWAYIQVTGRNDWTSLLSPDNWSFFHPGVNASVMLTDAIPSLKNNWLSYYRQYMPTRHLVDMLRDNNDPRLRVFCDPRPVLGNEPEGSADYVKFGLGDEHYVGIPYGQSDPPRMDYTCRTGLGILAGGSDKNAGAIKGNPFITGAEIGFYLAEAALRGLIPGGDTKAKEYYEQSVISAMKRHENAMQDKNFTMVGVAPAIETDAETAARDYLAQDNAFMNWDKMTTEAQKMDAIHSQKWLNYFGYNPLEAWFEARRTGYPSALVASNQAQENKLICKLPYPQTERNLNAENVALQGEVDVYNSLVFWDKENPIINRAELYQ